MFCSVKKYLPVPLPILPIPRYTGKYYLHVSVNKIVNANGIYTLRLVNWDKIPENGNYNGLYDLIVTAQLIGNNNNNVKVINWSTNENKNSLKIAGKDVAEFMDVEATPEHYKDTYVHNFVGSYRYTPTVTKKR